MKENNLPLIIDADGINLLSQNKDLLTYLPKNSILTPHPKELERLIGNWKNDYDKLTKTIQFSKLHSVIVIIKGAHSVIVNGNSLTFNSTGNPALATAGSGDVLTGLITGLIAQGYEPKDAAIFGVYLHGKTADIGIQEIGYEPFTASSILEYLPDAILDIFTSDEVPEENKDEEDEDNEDDKNEELMSTNNSLQVGNGNFNNNNSKNNSNTNSKNNSNNNSNSNSNKNSKK